jgi:hypothetical protein
MRGRERERQSCRKKEARKMTKERLGERAERETRQREVGDFG